MQRLIARARKQRESDRQRWEPAALICCVLANIHRDPTKTEPFTIADFLPGAPGRKTKEQEMEEFVEQIQSGEDFVTPPEQMAEFRQRLMSTFDV